MCQRGRFSFRYAFHRPCSCSQFAGSTLTRGRRMSSCVSRNHGSPGSSSTGSRLQRILGSDRWRSTHGPFPVAVPASFSLSPHLSLPVHTSPVDGDERNPTNEQHRRSRLSNSRSAMLSRSVSETIAHRNKRRRDVSAPSLDSTSADPGRPLPRAGSILHWPASTAHGEGVTVVHCRSQTTSRV